ncbi:MAG: 3D domain-containing protein [Candidatus Scalinduaceae bacterium]
MKISINLKLISLYVMGNVIRMFAVGMLIFFMINLLYATNLKAEVFTITAYCSCKKCCDKDPSSKWYGITATGKKARWGTVAVDRKVVRMGSKLRIAGFPNTIFGAEDVGGAIKGNHIDLWFPNHKEALKFGVHKKQVCSLESLFLRILLLSNVTRNSG